LPTSIGILQNLKMLNLSSNKLTSIPQILCSLKNLEALYLNNNRLKNIPIGLQKLPLLKKIDVRGNLLLNERDYSIRVKKKQKIIVKQKSLDDFF